MGLVFELVYFEAAVKQLWSLSHGGFPNTDIYLVFRFSFFFFFFFFNFVTCWNNEDY